MFLKNQSTNIDWFAGKDDNGQWEEYIFTVILVRIITSTSPCVLIIYHMV